jgi:hypothetical protein
LNIVSFPKSPNWAGEPLDSYQKILNFIRSTRTDTGLPVTAQLDRRNYPTGTEWNYTISPICEVVLASALANGHITRNRPARRA